MDEKKHLPWMVRTGSGEKFVCQGCACAERWPCPTMKAKADAEYAFITECDYAGHDDDQTACASQTNDDGASVRVYVWDWDTGELWPWGVMTLCETAWDNGRVLETQKHYADDPEVLVLRIARA